MSIQKGDHVFSRDSLPDYNLGHVPEVLQNFGDNL